MKKAQDYLVIMYMYNYKIKYQSSLLMLEEESIVQEAPIGNLELGSSWVILKVKAKDLEQ